MGRQTGCGSGRGSTWLIASCHLQNIIHAGFVITKSQYQISGTNSSINPSLWGEVIAKTFELDQRPRKWEGGECRIVTASLSLLTCLTSLWSLSKRRCSVCCFCLSFRLHWAGAFLFVHLTKFKQINYEHRTEKVRSNY